MIKEAVDDIQRYRRDQEANSQKFQVFAHPSLRYGAGSFKTVPSSDIKVSDVVILNSGQRVPADMILLRTKDSSGSIFIKTDQLDGETDWKVRKSVGSFQKANLDDDIWNVEGVFNIESPKKEIYDFAANFTPFKKDEFGEYNESESLSLENTLWANSVIASGSVLGLVIYTGTETRSALNTNSPPSKIGQTDTELNGLSKVLFLITIGVASILMLLKGLSGFWYIYFFRFVLLLSSIIPISLRINLDLAKTLYSVLISRDQKIPGSVARSSTIPEELGRISYLFTDKTGTLTQNVMLFKKLQMKPPFSFERENMAAVRTFKFNFNFTDSS
jgi:phospholipid-translocating ATPase